MAARNETIIVNRRPGDDEGEGLAWDSYRACRWEARGDGSLAVWAWRSGVAVLVAEYAPGQWAFVQRQRALA